MIGVPSSFLPACKPCTVPDVSAPTKNIFCEINSGDNVLLELVETLELEEDEELTEEEELDELEELEDEVLVDVPVTVILEDELEELLELDEIELLEELEEEELDELEDVEVVVEEAIVKVPLVVKL